MKKLILASSSPRRKELLSQLGLEFTIDASNIDEIVDPQLQPKEQVALFSLQKAKATAPKYENAIILAADSMVTIDGIVLGKAKDKQDAANMLHKLSGKEHSIITSFTLIDTESKKTVTKTSELKLWFKELTNEEIENYLKNPEYLDKAGAYAIQGLASVFVKKVEGDFLGGIGLPLFAVAQELKNFGISVL